MLTALGIWPTIISVIVTVIGSAGLGGLLKTWLDHKRGKQQETDQVAMNLVTQLTDRMQVVEASAQHERIACELKLAALRHKVGNIDSALDGLLMLLEMAPDKAAEAVVHIKAKRAEQRINETTETAAVTSAAAFGAQSR